MCCLFACSCVSKKEILYLQDAEAFAEKDITYTNSKIQPNDVLSVDIGALIPASTIPYNKGGNSSSGSSSVEILQLQGYLVSEELTINFPVLGILSVKDKTTQEFALYLKNLLETGGHLKAPTVDVRLLNAKVTILGEVKSPGTFNFTEQNITLLQALGYAGDLTINGKRDDILVMRDELGIRQISHIDLTSAEWLESPYYFIKPNDVIVINQNDPKVKTAGYIPSLTALLGVMTVSLSLVLLLTN
ncbi:polysaccharide biosynthesis/export family protein [Winogradskyella ludwigii]|uniref:polysaccharide biosynthesis/export family protein n=1 Tax=Winogradskyella ludwigii TaxID=2686076 RepID=UPI001FE753CD|nr:polysaccharide biosynthesis/export family protein [Winogradskyella ludwigii]